MHMDMGPIDCHPSMSPCIRLVFMLLICLSITVLTAAVERWLVFRQARRQAGKRLQLAVERLRRGGPEATHEAERCLGPGPLVRVFRAGQIALRQEDEPRPLQGESLIEAVHRA